MKNHFTRMFRSVLEWIRPVRRVQPEPRIAPEQLRQALADMLADPETRSLVLRNLMGNVFPISGGSPACIPAGDVNAGQFGSSAGCTSGDYNFPAKLAVGTTVAPLRRLHVVGAAADDFQARFEAAAGRGVALELYEAATSRGLISAGATGFDLFNGNIAGGPRVSIRQDTGNVGIGTTTPGQNLHVYEPTPGVNAAVRVMGGGQGAIFMDVYSGTAGQGLFGYGAAPLVFGVNGVERARVDAAGRLGVGTTTPAQNVHVYEATPGLNAVLRLMGGGQSGIFLDAFSGPALLGLFAYGPAPLVFGVDGAEKARITTAGNVGIGTTTPKGILDIAGKTVFLKPSPTGDDTSQINTAMNNLEASGGIVYLTPGLYLVTNLTGKSNVHLWGAGVGATTIRFTGPSGDMIKFQAKKNFSIRNITWDYNNLTADGKAIYVTVDVGGGVSTDFDVTDCSVINIGGPTITVDKYGIFVEAANNFRIERNYVKFVPSRQPNQAIVAAGTGATLAYNGIINANHCDGSGIQADGHDLKVTNNVVHDFQFGGGITTNPFSDNYDNTIIGNTIYNGTGLDVNDAWCAGIENFGLRSVISGNVCYGNAGPGIASGGFQCTVTNNVCYNNGANNDPRPVDPPQNPGRPGIAIIHAGFSDPIANANESVYVGNRCFDTRVGSSKTQLYGIGDETGTGTFCSDVTIGANNLLGNKNGEADIKGSNYAMFLHIPGGSVALSAPPSAPAGSALVKSNISFYLLEGPTNELKVRVKYSDGTTIKEGTIALF